MSNKKQSSIEWFLNEFSKQIEFVPESELDKWFKELIPKAKAMHKEEIEKLLKIIDWYDNHGDVRPDNETYSWFIQLWNKTFGGQDESNH